MKTASKHLINTLGPGMLLAAAAVGGSHLVLSTRGGAMHGMAFLLFIVLAMAVKYPAYRFAPYYTNVTGVSMLEGFRRRGLWALILFAISASGTLIIGLAGVTLICASIAKTTLNLEAGAVVISGWVFIITAVLLIIGRYHLLDLLMKVLMVVLFLLTILATALTIPLIDWSVSGNLFISNYDQETISLLAALFGWMPAPLEVAIIYTLWAQAKIHDTGYKPNPRESSIDFHIGYYSTLILAICFMLLGTGVMHGSGQVFDKSSGGFAAQVISLYTQALGDWTRPLIAASALSVMYSTVITALDGHSRILATLIMRFKGPEEVSIEREFHSRSVLYILSMLVLGGGAYSMILFLLKSFTVFVDIAATMSFLSMPVIGFLIHRTLFSNDMPAQARLKPAMRFYSIVCIVLMAAFAAGYLYLVVNK